VCAHGDGWLQEGGGSRERGLCCAAKLPMTAHPPIIPLLLPWEGRRDKARGKEEGMGGMIDKVIQV